MEIDEQVVMSEVNKARLKRNGRNAKQTPDAHTQHPKEQKAPVAAPQSPLEAYELTLLRYVVRYGEQPLYEFSNAQTGEPVVLRVAEFIRQELDNDDMPFQTPLYKKMLDGAADYGGDEGFVASRYFLHHPDEKVSRLAADLISEKYRLSKYHTKYKEIKSEEKQLTDLVVRDLLGFKDACIRLQIGAIGDKIKELQQKGETEQIVKLMEEQNKLNAIKKALNKRIGERIVLPAV